MRVLKGSVPQAIDPIVKEDVVAKHVDDKPLPQFTNQDDHLEASRQNTLYAVSGVQELVRALRPRGKRAEASESPQLVG
jgi:hypothetical protein